VALSLLANPARPPAMASAAAAPAGEASTSELTERGKPIVVRVKRKPSQTRPDAFCELPFSFLFVPLNFDSTRGF